MRILGQGDEPDGDPQTFPFTPNAISVLQRRARSAARAAGDSKTIDTEHLLLGLMQLKTSVAVRVLEDFDATPEQVRAEIARLQRPAS